MSFQAMKIYGRSSNAYHEVKEANRRQLHVVWLQLRETLEKETAEIIQSPVSPGAVVRGE